MNFKLFCHLEERKITRVARQRLENYFEEFCLRSFVPQDDKKCIGDNNPQIINLIMKKTLLIAAFLCCIITSSKAQVVGVEVGDIAPEIDLPNTKGENVALSSLRGSLVLVDFWASWCGPCIKEQPALLKLHNAYPDRLSIYAVSMDTKKALWTAAITKAKLPWTNVSDLKYWQSPAVADYKLQSVPLNYLIDKNGIILAKNIHGRVLEDKIKELLEAK